MTAEKVNLTGDSEENPPLAETIHQDDSSDQLENGKVQDDGNDTEKASSSLVETRATVPLQPLWQRVLNSKSLPDNQFSAFGYDVVDGPAFVKFLKFLTLTYISFFIVYGFVRWVDWENDEFYKIEYFWKFDNGFVVVDALFFFIVGRLNRKGGVDHLAWFLPVMASTLLSSGFTRLDFMQHSISRYEMKCLWPPALWVFAIFAVTLVASSVIVHVRRIVLAGKLLEKILEIAFCIVFFVVPYISSPFFHFHHWYAGWLFGMHFNLDVWWSRVTMAFCWGMYINGIAVYGRDPILGCEYSFYVSAMQGCSYMKCYDQGISEGAGNEGSNYTGVVTPFEPLDWRTCSV
jgi:hypothetical protein